MNTKEIMALVGLFLFGLITQAQITLKKYDDPELKGRVESIVFKTKASQKVNGAAAQTITKEYNIQENNPYNKLNYQVVKESDYGLKTYKIAAHELKSNSGLFSHADVSLEGKTNVFSSSNSAVRSSEKYVLIGYELIYQIGNEYVQEGRRSSFVLLNEFGDPIFEITDQESDFYQMAVSENGKFLAFATGEMLEHGSKIITQEIRIYDVEKKEIFYQEQGYCSFMSQLFGMIRIETFRNGKKRCLILDESNEKMYEKYYELGFDINGYNDFLTPEGPLKFSNLTEL